jgi:hypothetical protein
MWQVSLLLANADKLTEPVKALLANSTNVTPEATGAKSKSR